MDLPERQPGDVEGERLVEPHVGAGPEAKHHPRHHDHDGARHHEPLRAAVQAAAPSAVRGLGTGPGTAGDVGGRGVVGGRGLVGGRGAAGDGDFDVHLRHRTEPPGAVPGQAVGARRAASVRAAAAAASTTMSISASPWARPGNMAS